MKRIVVKKIQLNDKTKQQEKIGCGWANILFHACIKIKGFTSSKKLCLNEGPYLGFSLDSSAKL